MAAYLLRLAGGELVDPAGATLLEVPDIDYIRNTDAHAVELGTFHVEHYAGDSTRGRGPSTGIVLRNGAKRVAL